MGYWCTWNVNGNGNDQLGNSPEGNPAMDASGRVYVSDTNNQRVQIFNANGSYFNTLGTGTWGTGNYDFAVPNGISISPLNGDIYVADMGNHRIQIFTSARAYKATLGQAGVPGSANTQFNGLAAWQWLPTGRSMLRIRITSASKNAVSQVVSITPAPPLREQPE